MPTDQTRAMGRNFEDSLAYNEGRSWFFGIGINQYEHFSNLRNAVKDVEDMILVLQEKYDLEPDHIITLFDENANRANIIRTFDRLQKEVGPEDKLLIYYSGHGHLIDTGKTKKGFWVPTDAEKDNTAQYIRNSTVREYLEDIDSLHTLLISDSCFSGSLFVRGASRSGTAIDELEQLKSRWAICSGRHNEEVYDGAPGTNSPFADSILDTLRNNLLPKFNVAKLADRVVEVTRSNYRQLPEGNPLYGVGHKGGQYVFALKADEEADWKICQEAGSIKAYQTFLSNHPTGNYSKLAKEILFELEEEAAWERAKATDTIMSYYYYSQEFPGGKYQLDSLTAVKKLEEDALWQRALHENTLSSFMEYKSRYPQGRFLEEAQGRIKEILGNEKPGNQIGSIEEEDNHQVEKKREDNDGSMNSEVLSNALERSREYKSVSKSENLGETRINPERALLPWGIWLGISAFIGISISTYHIYNVSPVPVFGLIILALSGLGISVIFKKKYTNFKWKQVAYTVLGWGAGILIGLSIGYIIGLSFTFPASSFPGQVEALIFGFSGGIVSGVTGFIVLYRIVEFEP